MRRNPKQKKWWNREKTCQCFIKINSVTTECIHYDFTSFLFLFLYVFCFPFFCFHFTHTNNIGFSMLLLSFVRYASFTYKCSNGVWMCIEYILPVHGFHRLIKYFGHIRQYKTMTMTIVHAIQCDNGSRFNYGMTFAWFGLTCACCQMRHWPFDQPKNKNKKRTASYANRRESCGDFFESF